MAAKVCFWKNSFANFANFAGFARGIVFEPCHLGCYEALKKPFVCFFALFCGPIASVFISDSKSFKPLIGACQR